jgi:hypothetical protein
MKWRRQGLLVIIIGILIATDVIDLGKIWDSIGGTGDYLATLTPVDISPQREQHILYGDATGGGHKFGVGKPCKSEFPQDWNDDKIIGTIERIAANDNLFWKEQDNGYYAAEQSVEGVKIRVILDKQRDDVVTGYPVNRKRNRCGPAPANDN